MEFPSSTIPTDRQTTWSVVSMYEANKPYDKPWVVYATRFPILRSSPLWAQTWIWYPRNGVGSRQRLCHSPGETPSGYRWREGYWFPPARCDLGFKGARTPLYAGDDFDCLLPRLYSSPRCRCATCLENAQTVELMLVGIESIGRADAWPDEHRCHWREPDGRQRHDCTCGMPYSWLNVGQWYIDEEADVLDWAWKNRCANGDGPLSFTEVFA